MRFFQGLFTVLRRTSTSQRFERRWKSRSRRFDRLHERGVRLVDAYVFEVHRNAALRALALVHPRARQRTLNACQAERVPTRQRSWGRKRVVADLAMHLFTQLLDIPWNRWPEIIVLSHRRGGGNRRRDGRPPPRRHGHSNTSAKRSEGIKPRLLKTSRHTLSCFERFFFIYTYTRTYIDTYRLSLLQLAMRFHPLWHDPTAVRVHPAFR